MPTYPGRSPGSRPGALGRQEGGGCALGIRSMARRAGATVRSWVQESAGEGGPGGASEPLRCASAGVERPETRWAAGRCGCGVLPASPGACAGSRQPLAPLCAQPGAASSCAFCAARAK